MRHWGVYSGQVDLFDFLWLRFDSTALFYLTMTITTTTKIPSSSCQPTIERSRPRLSSVSVSQHTYDERWTGLSEGHAMNRWI